MTGNLSNSFKNLVNTVAKLRDPNNGCPWDLEQNHLTLLPYLIEETQEFMAVIENNEEQHIKEELGDLLFQVVLHAQLAQEKNLFNIIDLCDFLNKKLVDRHPHVFEQGNRNITSEEVLKQWNKNKIKSKGIEKLHEAIKLAPLLSAHKIGAFSQTVGFDWENSLQVFEKVKEELSEVQLALDSFINKKTTSNNEVVEEIGDLLFSIAQLARHLKVNADYCLFKANQKFYNRFLKMIDELKIQKKELTNMSLQEKEELWQKVKSKIDEDKL